MKNIKLHHVAITVSLLLFSSIFIYRNLTNYIGLCDIKLSSIESARGYLKRSKQAAKMEETNPNDDPLVNKAKKQLGKAKQEYKNDCYWHSLFLK